MSCSNSTAQISTKEYFWSNKTALKEIYFRVFDEHQHKGKNDNNPLIHYNFRWQKGSDFCRSGREVEAVQAGGGNPAGNAAGEYSGEMQAKFRRACAAS